MGPILLLIWKRLPAPWRRSAHAAVNIPLRLATPLLMALAWRRGRPSTGAVVVAGYFSTSRGLGQGSRLFVEALEAGDVPTAALDVTRAFQLPPDLPYPASSPPPPGGVLISQINPVEFLRFLPRGYWRALRGRRHIGYWAWELADIPRAWTAAFAYVDEVWCPSTFTADAVRKAAPAGMAVHVLPYPLFVTPRPPPERARWGLRPTDCVVLMAVDLKSIAVRKNAEGALEAYRRAVPAPRDGVRLVCKVSGAGEAPALFAALQAQLRARGDIVLVKAALSALDMVRLIASADIVLSLHRSEGYGLMAAQGLWLGRCVVTTAWSGVMDFLHEDAAVLVPWTRTPVQDSQGLYAGGWWAEPVLDAAAAELARLIDDPAARADLGRRAQAHADKVFDREAWLSRARDLLGQAPAPATPSYEPPISSP